MPRTRFGACCLLLALSGCECIFDPSRIAPSNGSVSDYWLPAGDSGSWCAKPANANCPSECLYDGTGTFQGQASLLAVRGPTPGYGASAVALSDGTNVWLGNTGDGGLTLTRQVAVSGGNTVSALAVVDGHPAGGGPCVLALYAAGSQTSLVSSGKGVCSSAMLPFTLDAPFGGAWMQGPDGGGLVAVVGGLSGYIFDETAGYDVIGRPNFAQPLGQITSATQASGYPGAWLVAGSQPPGVDTYDALLTTAETQFGQNQNPTLIDTTTTGQGVAAYFLPDSGIGDAGPGMEMLTFDLTNGIPLYYDPPQLATTGFDPATARMTHWSSSTTEDVYRMTYVADGGVGYVDWHVDNASTATLHGPYSSACVLPKAVEAYALPGGALISRHPGGFVSLSSLP